MPEARWYFRAIQVSDDRWECRRGRTAFDTHERLDDALAHLTELADEHRPSEIFVHHLDGRVQSVATLDAV